MHRLSSPSRPLVSFMVAAQPRWWPPTLVRRVFPLMPAPIPTIHHVSRFSRGPRSVATISRVKGNESGKSCRILPISSNSVSISPQGRKHAVIHEVNNTDTGNAEKTKNIETRETISSIETDNAEKVKNTETRGTISEVIDEDEKSDKDTYRTTTEVIDGDIRGPNVNITSCKEHQRSTTKGQTAKIIVSEDEEVSDDEKYFPFSNVLARSRHRDGSIYRGMDLWWKEEYHIANRNETRLEAMMLSHPTDCSVREGFCRVHNGGRMLQIFSLELAEICLDGGLVELYGYIAVRDDLDPLLNYIVKISRDDPISVEQGSLINVAGPKRGMHLLAPILIEYDMRIKRGQEDDDLQLIDGVSFMGTAGTWNQPFTMRIPGDCGVIGINLSRIDDAVEATIDIHVSEVQSSFSLSLRCLTSGLDEEIWLFDGSITESRGLKRSVVAVMRNSLLDLKFGVGTPSTTSDKYCSCFSAKTHGHDIHNLKTYFALFSVKVTWSTLPDYIPRPRH